jgi:FAD/FMN-containing dehydrogenase
MHPPIYGLRVGAYGTLGAFPDNDNKEGIFMASVAESVGELAPGFIGQLLQPTDAGYDAARRVHNGLVDKRPALIARCAGVADVVDAVKLARTLNLEVAVRGGGHNVAGRATVDGGLMIDLSPLKGIEVDLRTRTVKAQGGVLWRELNRETQLHGLATTGGVVSSTGIAGLTLGGGLGWLMCKHGLALDNLRSAVMVLADGSVKCASADDDADLFWAIRGGGGNFGIATSLEYAVHPVGPVITGGLAAYPLQRGAEVLSLFRDVCATASDDLMVAAAMLTAPDGSGAKLIGIVIAHFGSLADGETATKPFKALGPVMDMMGPIPYSTHNSLLDHAFPRGALNYWKSQFLTGLTDDAVRTLVECFEACPSAMSQMVIEHFHGAVTRVPVSATACAMRDNAYNVVVASQWSDPLDGERNIQWARHTYAALKPYFAAMRYVNYLDNDEGANPAAMAYGPNYPRLKELKAKFDPDNFFRGNVNIAP